MFSIVRFVLLSLLLVFSGGSLVQAGQPQAVLQSWYGLILELVRHTPTYSPPVASRAFAYLGVTAFEVTASQSAELTTLAGQLNELQSLPLREAGAAYDEALVLHVALSTAAADLFGNTGPTGQRALAKLTAKISAEVSVDLPADVVNRSTLYGQAVAAQVLAWSREDGGATIENMGFPMAYTLTKGEANWVPTGPIAQQQNPLLPNWGKNRTFAMPNGATCSLPPPPVFSEDKTSAFYAEALEVAEIKKNITPEQKAIARFWSDDPMLSPTPPGHWISIALQLFERDGVAFDKQVEVLALVGLAEADGFIGCWDSKFSYNLLRPITYIKRVIDPKWEPLLITPPFPEYPSGHSTQSGAAAVVLTKLFGENFSFEDNTHKRDGLPARRFTSFHAAAEEAALSRLYGGIHYRAAIEQGLVQGRCIGGYVTALKTRK